jgi:hypothetical protein
MPHYLLTVYQPDGAAPPEDELRKIMADVESWTEELKSANAWVFEAGLHPPTTATVLRPGDGLVTDGPYVEGKEHIGGFTIIDVPDLDAALEWARKGVSATTLPIEVRPMSHAAGA